MFTEIVTKLEMNRIERTLMYEMATIYEENLPESLYLNQYELANEFGFTHMDWNKFLKVKDIDRLIEAEIAQISEIGARYALGRLQASNASSADIQAARELINNSRLLQQKHNQRAQIIITRIPAKEVVENGK